MCLSVCQVAVAKQRPLCGQHETCKARYCGRSEEKPTVSAYPQDFTLETLGIPWDIITIKNSVTSFKIQPFFKHIKEAWKRFWSMRKRNQGRCVLEGLLLCFYPGCRSGINSIHLCTSELQTGTSTWSWTCCCVIVILSLPLIAGNLSELAGIHLYQRIREPNRRVLDWKQAPPRSNNPTEDQYGWPWSLRRLIKRLIRNSGDHSENKLELLQIFFCVKQEVDTSQSAAVSNRFSRKSTRKFLSSPVLRWF